MDPCHEYLEDLGSLKAGVKERIKSLEQKHILTALEKKDPSIWTDSIEGQNEIAIRLGWLNAPQEGFAMIPLLENLHNSLINEGYTKAVLIGMGGSSLAAEVMSKILGVQNRGLELRILDSTDPAQVKHIFEWLDIEKAVFLISSKSGGTAEVMAGFQYAWKQVEEKVKEEPGSHFIAVTDPGTTLQKLAEEHHFRIIVNADPNVGGRYSALIAFGLVPAALLGTPLKAFLESAQRMQFSCSASQPAGENPGLVLGAVLGEAYLAGMDKLTILTDPSWSSFGSWVEQLVAESSGKEGRGILPIDQEPLMQPETYSQDRLFIYVRKNGDLDDQVTKIKNFGHPVLILDVSNEYSLASEFYRWEFATAIACAIIGVNAFDQPNVQDSKTRTKQKIKVLQETGKLELERPLCENEQFKIFTNIEIECGSNPSLKLALHRFLEDAVPTDYVAINAFLERNPQNFEKLQEIRTHIANRFHLATTLGFGPRFLHSTGQLHKGGKNNGFFIVITMDEEQNMPVPNQGISFKELLYAQALGDIEALKAAGRRVLCVHLKSPELRGLLDELKN